MKTLLQITVSLSVILAAAIGSYGVSSLVRAQQPDVDQKSQNIEPIIPLNDAEMARLFHPGELWDGIGKHMTEEEARAFADYPLFWFGPQIHGYNLQTIRHYKYTAPEGATPVSMDRFTFIYGSCTPESGHNRCAVPAYIHVQPICAVTPDMVSRQGEPVRTVANGAKMQVFVDGHVVVWTEGVSIDIGIVGTTITEDDIAKLQRLNPNEFSSIGDLRAPDFTGC